MTSEIYRDSISWPREWLDNPQLNNTLQQLELFMRGVQNAQYLQVIDETVQLSGETVISSAFSGMVYTGGFVAGTGTLTVGDDSDADGLLTSTAVSGIQSFNGAYISSQETVGKDRNIVANGSDSFRIVIYTYFPAL